MSDKEFQSENRRMHLPVVNYLQMWHVSNILVCVISYVTQVELTTVLCYCYLFSFSLSACLSRLMTVTVE